MISFIAQRIAKAIIVLLALVVLNFFLIRMAPGDPALVMAGEAGAGDNSSWPSCAKSSVSTSRCRCNCSLRQRHSQPRSRIFVSPADAGVEADPRSPGDAAADGDRVLAGIRHPVRRLAARWPAPGRHRDHGAGADLLRHAAVLGRADGDPAVSVTMDWLPSFGYETVGATTPGSRTCSTSPPTWSCRRPPSACSSWPPMPHDPRLDARGQAGSTSSRRRAPRVCAMP